MDAAAYALLVSWGLLENLPPVSDLQHFPGWSVAQEQVERTCEHQKRLHWLGGIRGHGRYGRWQLAEEESARHEEYWRALLTVHETWWDERQQQRALARFRRQVGWYQYQQRWHPPTYPPRERFVLTDQPEAPASNSLAGQ